MKKWKMQFTPEAARLLSKLHPESKKHIKKALNELRQNPYAGKDLQEELFGFKSLKINKYRIIYYITYIQHPKSRVFVNLFVQFSRLERYGPITIRPPV